MGERVYDLKHARMPGQHCGAVDAGSK